MMRLIVHSGNVELERVPAPALGRGEVLIQTLYSAMSVGTEKAMIRSSGMSVATRVRADPSLVTGAIRMLLSSGTKSTLDTVRSITRGEEPLGYSSCGRVIAVGEAVTDIQPGAIVACGGAGKASHAEYAAVPRNLCTVVPDLVSPRDASFATIGSIAVHALRQSHCDFGERIGVIGLGFIGHLVCRIGLAAGMEIFALEPDKLRLASAKSSRIQTASDSSEYCSMIDHETGGKGVDATIICASTDSSEPVDISMTTTRNRGRIVIVGLVPTVFERNHLYGTEVSVCVSRSYGPGRYDPQYEEKGLDYPPEYVRWTINRNMSYFLECLANGSIAVSDLITDEVPLRNTPKFYETMVRGKSNPLGAVIRYVDDIEDDSFHMPSHTVGSKPEKKSTVGVSVIGSGSFATGVLLPILRTYDGVEIRGVCTKSPTSSRDIQRSWKPAFVTTEIDEVLSDTGTDLVIIATPHNLHSQQLIRVLHHNKSVFVEKPLAMNREELAAILEAERGCNRVAMVGFNRRYSSIANLAREYIVSMRGPKILTYEVHTNPIPDNSWVGDPDIGGGPLVGECCHFFDLMRFFLGVEWKRVSASVIKTPKIPHRAMEDFTVGVSWQDGSYSNLIFTTIGAPGLSKEVIRIHAGNQTVEIDNFRRLTFLSSKKKGVKLKHPDKGHKRELHLLLDAVKAGSSSIQTLDDAARSMELTFDAVEVIRSPSDASSIQ